MAKSATSKRGQLHIRGDVSRYVNRLKKVLELAPHTWRCFRFQGVCRSQRKVSSTYVEMFLQQTVAIVPFSSQLHIRGDVSGSGSGKPTKIRLAPHTWRCFYWQFSLSVSVVVSSTYVEMFLSPFSLSAFQLSQLHIRGDVSLSRCHIRPPSSLAPHTWRCFR